MKRITGLFFALGMLLLSACSPIKTPVSNQYKLAGYSHKSYSAKTYRPTILITEPEAVAGYQTSQMLYMIKPFELTPFANNAWIDPPAQMLLPLLAQSMQSSGYFSAVASSATSENTDYRLDTQLLELQQNFLNKLSVLELRAKIVLTHMKDNRVMGSRIISLRVPCAMNSPYGGVLAANKATEEFTAQAVEYTIRKIRGRG